MRILSRQFLSTTWSYFNRNPQLSLSAKTIRLCSSVPIHSIEKKVDSFGKLVIDLPYNVEIKPTDPHEYPDMDTVLVKLFSKQLIDKKDDLIVVDVSNVTTIKAVDSDFIGDVKCVIQIPVSYDVDAKTAGEGNVFVSGLISNSINVQTEYGNIVGAKLQGENIILSSSEGGSITLQNGVQGNIEINTAGDGTVTTEKCLGNKLDISTENGDINLGSNYCEKATFSTVNGNMYLNNLHLNSSVDIDGTGSLNISCLDGSLQANLHEGPAKIQLVRLTGDSEINSQGHVNLTVPEDNDAKLILKASKLDIDGRIIGVYSDDNKEFISENNGNAFKVETSQSIQVTPSNWMESLDLKRSVKKH
ncbi:protein FAM185A-like [Microplitis mediator]|uniref:protein FAM185A-like n=1 Tax=Microplitis mediator TaxID=375433 RepID=UPI002555BC12|nr:protein FAM185A-like [Microplitis mediator]